VNEELFKAKSIGRVQNEARPAHLFSRQVYCKLYAPSGAGEVLTSRCSRGGSSRPLELCASELRPSARTRPIVGKLFLERRGDRKSYQISSSKSLLAVLKVIRAGLPLRVIARCSLDGKLRHEFSGTAKDGFIRSISGSKVPGQSSMGFFKAKPVYLLGATLLCALVEWGLWVKKKVNSKGASADQFALQVYHNSPYLDKSAVFTPGPYAIPILNSFP
jgi:hypothetical protein